MCVRVASEDLFMLSIAPVDIKLKECMMNLLMIVWQH